MNGMKRTLVVVLAGCVLLLAGCNPDDETQQDKRVCTAFTATLNPGVQPAAGVQPRAAMDLPTRYIMEIFEGTTAVGSPVLHMEQSTGVFENVILKDKQPYTVLFWADFGTPTPTNGTLSTSNEYDASDLKAVRVVEGKQATQVAYAGASRFLVGDDDEAVYTQVTLTHAVSQVNFKQTEALTSEENALVVTYPKSFSLNVDGMGTTEIAGAQVHNFTYNSKLAGTLGTAYLIAASGATKTVMDITTDFTSGGIKTTKQLTSIPFECNYRTNLYGAFSDLYNATLTVTCDDQWEATGNQVVFPSPKQGDYYYSDKTFSTERNTSKTVIGLVFWVDPTNPAKGKIVSLDETISQWSFQEVSTNAWDMDNGLTNLQTIKALTSNDLTLYPMFTWAESKNASVPEGMYWYIPARNELAQLFNWWSKSPAGNNTLITNSGVAGASGIYLGMRYWSSTEDSTNPVTYGLRVLSNDGASYQDLKSDHTRVRAISTF